MIKTLKEANAIAGTIGNPSKMPGMSYGLPAAEAKFVPDICLAKGWMVPSEYGCSIGSILSKIKGSVCHTCYADDRNNYSYPSVHIAHTKRIVGIYKAEWVAAMVFLLGRTFDKMFRETLAEKVDDFFIDNDSMPTKKDMHTLEKMALKECAYFRWHDSGDILNTWHLNKIYEVCRRTPYLHHWLPTRETNIVLKTTTKKPDNLVIRHSAQMVDGPLPKRVSFMSNVTAVGDYKGMKCNASSNNNMCGSCRWCWDKKIECITYPKH